MIMARMLQPISIKCLRAMTAAGLMPIKISEDINLTPN